MTFDAEHDLNAIAAYVENRLSPAERTRVTAHLAGCPECRAVLAGFLRADRSHSAAFLPEGPALWRRMPVWLPVAASLMIAVAAGVLYLRREPLPSSAPAAAPTVSPADQPPAATPPSIPPAAGTTPERGTQTTRAAGERVIAGKTFRLEAGEWVDTAYDPFGLLETVSVKTAQDRDRVLAAMPAMRPYAALGSRFTVVHDGRVYKFDLPAASR